MQARDDALCNLFDLDIADAAGNIQVDADRRGEQADGQVHDHNGAQVDGVNAQLQRDGGANSGVKM